jgi:arylsulfatase A-like enzyme
VFFSKVIAYAPFTIAAMHAIFSGNYGTKNGVNSYWSSPKFKKNEFKTLTKYLQDENFVTHADTINTLVLPKTGFGKFIVHDELNDDLTQRHIELLDEVQKHKNAGKKFFLYLHYSNIHTGIMKNVLKKYNNFSTEYFANREKNIKFYDELFFNSDIYLGKILQHYQNLNLDEDTLLVVISDHGISTGEKFGERAYGVFCYDYTLLSGAMFYHKNIKPVHIENQVRSIDILPTILDLLSIKEDSSYEKIQGKSLVPIMEGKNESRIAFSQSGNPLNSSKPPKEPNVSAIRTDEWKFILNHHDGTEELYNLKTDPTEENNLIAMENKVVGEMKKTLKHHLEI